MCVGIAIVDENCDVLWLHLNLIGYWRTTVDIVCDSLLNILE